MVTPPAEALRLINFSTEVQEELDQIAASLGRRPSPMSGRRIIEGRAYDTEGRLVLGQQGARHAMELLHHAAGGHLGWRKTKDKFCQRFCADNTTPLAKEIVASCVGCQKATDYKRRPAPAGSIRTCFPWDILAIDVMGPFPLQQGKQYVISCLDAFSRFTVLVPVPGHTASTAARVLFTHVIAVFGVPSRILSDQGPEFTGKVWDELQEFLGCTLIRTSPYHPQGNGAVERCHRTVNNIVRAIIHSTSPSTWPEAVPCAQLALNSAPSDAHGYSPFEIIFGHMPRLPAEQHLIPRHYDPAGTPRDQYLANLRCTLAAAHQLVRQHTNRPYSERENPFSAGQLIWVLAPPYTRPNKLSPKWLGPYEVQATPNPFQVTYIHPGGTRTVHINDAKPGGGPPQLTSTKQADAPVGPAATTTPADQPTAQTPAPPSDQPDQPGPLQPRLRPRTGLQRPVRYRTSISTLTASEVAPPHVHITDLWVTINGYSPPQARRRQLLPRIQAAMDNGSLLTIRVSVDPSRPPSRFAEALFRTIGTQAWTLDEASQTWTTDINTPPER